MNSFEQEYYEDEHLWAGDMLQDAGNTERIRITEGMIPESVKSLLDVGCGNGVFLNHLLETRKSIKLTGVDRSIAALQFVKADKKEGDITHLEFENGSFDCVSCLEVIEHLPIQDYKRALSEIARVSKKYVIISVPYAEYLEDNFLKCPECKTMFNRDFHMRSFSDTVVKSLLEELGYKNIAIKKAGKVEVYVGQQFVRRILNKSRELPWNYSICPMCGYKEKPKVEQAVIQQKTSESFLRKLAAIPKAFWPKTFYHYWIIGLFEKNPVEN